MTKTPLVELLDVLVETELGQLKKWLLSPFFNKREDVIELFNLYRKFRKKNASMPSKEVVFEQLFPNEQYDDHKMRLVMSFLKKQSEQFLIFQEQRAKKEEQKIILSKIYRERKLRKHAQKTLKKVATVLDNYPYRNEVYFRLNYEYQTEEYKNQVLDERTNVTNIQKLLDYLDKAYLFEKLKMVCIAGTHMLASKVTYNFFLLDNLLKQFRENPEILNSPAHATMYACYLNIIDRDSDRPYQNFKRLLFKNQHYFPIEEKQFFFFAGVNSLVMLQNKGKHEVIKEIFDLYKYMIELKLFPVFSSFMFKNIVLCAATVGKHEWALEFIENNKGKLKGKDVESIVNLCYAIILKHQEKYDAVLIHLRETQFEDVHHKITVKGYILVTLFKLREIEAFEYHVNSFIAFIRKNKDIKEDKRRWQMNFALTFKKINRLNPYDKTAKQALRQEIEDMKELPSKPLLLDCIDEL